VRTIASAPTTAPIGHALLQQWLLPFELGTRFLTDHLKGDLYFKVSRRGENLERASRQFDLVRDIERQQERLECAIQAAWARM
jgi:hypothetical protein